MSITQTSSLGQTSMWIDEYVAVRWTFIMPRFTEGKIFRNSLIIIDANVLRK